MEVLWRKVERVGFSGGVDGRGGALRSGGVGVFRGGDRRSNGSAFFGEVRFAPIRETPLLTLVNLKAIEGDGGDGGTIAI